MNTPVSPFYYFGTGPGQAPDKHVRPGEDPGRESRQRRLRIAVAEDNRADVLLVEETLHHHGIEADLTVCRDGEDMLRLIEAMENGSAARPDLILLDLNLPRRSGQALLARIRQSGTLSDIPVIIVTSSNAAKDRSSVAELGASAYFQKPSDYDDFLKLGDVIREITDL